MKVGNSKNANVQKSETFRSKKNINTKSQEVERKTDQRAEQKVKQRRLERIGLAKPQRHIRRRPKKVPEKNMEQQTKEKNERAETTKTHGPQNEPSKSTVRDCNFALSEITKKKKNVKVVVNTTVGQLGAA